ncbi:hypothetical protein [Streptomyces sp. PU-14G]|uniref:hypothetical protein n=1 Tax=Streptomyces sp. PU-14G TaxID=2800808 RepID=UPI0034DED848
MALTPAKATHAVALAVGLLCAGGTAGGTAWAAGAHGSGTETPGGPSLIRIDNTDADSWLEVDRTLNTLAPLSKGTAGSDHDGGGGAVEQHVSGSRDTGLQAAPEEGCSCR